MSRPVSRCTKKRRYDDRIAAELAVAEIWRHGGTRDKTPVRSYACTECDGWHLTSTGNRLQPRWKR